MQNLAAIGTLCPEYVSLMNLVERRVHPKDLPPDCELKQTEGSLQELRVVQMNNVDRLLCIDSAVYVPKGERGAITSHRVPLAPCWRVEKIECIDPP